MGIVDSWGKEVVRYRYDAWGNLLETSGDMADTLGKLNVLRYRGYVYDDETGLYYLKARYYNPAWGRFISSDRYASTGQGMLGSNMFAYCNNDPVMMVDSDGTVPFQNLLMADNGGGFGYGYGGAGGGIIIYVVFALLVSHTSRCMNELPPLYLDPVDDDLPNQGIVSDSTPRDIIIEHYPEETEMPRIQIETAKGHQGNMRDTGLIGVTDSEIRQRLKDPNTTAAEKKRLVREQKARRTRDIKKRRGYIHKEAK